VAKKENAFWGDPKTNLRNVQIFEGTKSAEAKNQKPEADSQRPVAKITDYPVQWG